MQPLLFRCFLLAGKEVFIKQAAGLGLALKLPQFKLLPGLIQRLGFEALQIRNKPGLLGPGGGKVIGDSIGNSLCLLTDIDADLFQPVAKFPERRMASGDAGFQGNFLFQKGIFLASQSLDQVDSRNSVTEPGSRRSAIASVMRARRASRSEAVARVSARLLLSAWICSRVISEP